MNISIILCTHNRCTTLSHALESVLVSSLPESLDWELLVVDNNSSDQTREVVESFCRKYPKCVRYLFEPHPGKSYALNSAISQSKGAVLAFVDDDVTVDPQWLQNLTAPLTDTQFAGSGGRILPAPNYSLPPWLALDGRYTMGFAVAAIFDLGAAPLELDCAPYGTNMAFRREMFAKYGGFRTDMGPGPGNQIRNEDTEFGRRLLAAGERLRYVPSAIVYHPVVEARSQKAYLLRWWFDHGRAGIRESGQRPDIWGIPRRYITMSKIVTTTLAQRFSYWLFAMNPKRRFYFKCMVWTTFGQLVEIHRLWRSAKPSNNDAIPATNK